MTSQNDEASSSVTREQREVLSDLLRIYRVCARRAPVPTNGRYAGLRMRVDVREALHSARLVACYLGQVNLKGLPSHERMPIRDALTELEALESHPRLATILSL